MAFCFSQSFAWSSCSEWSVGQRVPFVVDVCPMTFEQLDLLLRQVSEGMDGSSDWPPPQEKECMVVATLNLLRLQVTHSSPSLDVSLQCHFFSFQIVSVIFNFCLTVLMLQQLIFGLQVIIFSILLSSMQPSVTRWIQRSWDWGLAACCLTT